MSELSVRETAARALAQLGPDEDWPTNEALGGNPTGTRDDEYRAAMLDDADRVLAAVAAHDGLADALRAVLTADGVDDVGGIHHWRCEHPKVYGPCTCFDELLAHLADVVRAWMVQP